VGEGNLNSKARKTLQKVFRHPTASDVRYADIEHLLRALDGEKREGRGSRVRFYIKGHVLTMHKPHPSSVVKKYVVEEVRAFLKQIGVEP